MALLIISFIAGTLTVLAPCILPLLPVIIGSSASGQSRYTPYIVIASLALSIIAFTFVLKVSTAFISIPPQVWTYLSGGILFLFGLVLLFPSIWEKIPGIASLSTGSNRLVGQGYKKKSFWGDVLIGAALGPVFSTCSPTYFVILASVLPVSFALGSLYLLAYVAGLCIVLLLLAFLGDKLARRLTGLSDPKGWFKRSIGALFIVIAIFIAFGYDKVLQTKILDSGFFDVTKIEQKLLERFDGEDGSNLNAPYTEIVEPSGFVNSEGITLGELVGKKVILIDFMTYSCINCQRTFPYLNTWYEKYKDQGLEIVGIHTPEFAFEKKIENVKRAMEGYGIKFPVVLDNEYKTWDAYGNRYWPRKYLIDIEGNIVYDHIGEGKYDETERKIQELLMKRKARLGESGTIKTDLAELDYKIESKSPETYFGWSRNELLGNGKQNTEGIQNLNLPARPSADTLYLGGTWDILPEYAQSISDNSTILYKYNAREVYIVAESDSASSVEILQDGEKVNISAGADVDKDGILKIKESRLYKLIKNEEPGEHTLELRIKNKGVRFYAFTFG